MTSLFKVVLFSSRAEAVDKVRKTVAEHPAAPFRWTVRLLFILTLLVTGLSEVFGGVDSRSKENFIVVTGVLVVVFAVQAVGSSLF